MDATTIRRDNAAEGKKLALQLALARKRLVAELASDDVSAAEVESAFERNERRFDNARVRSFVSILVERSVREEVRRGQQSKDGGNRETAGAHNTP